MTVSTVDLQGLQRLLAGGAQLVEVLPVDEYEELHLRGAINIPLKQLDATSAARLDPERDVVVYCWDALCDMSPRAAARLETLGFTQVHDYAASKVGVSVRRAVARSRVVSAWRCRSHSRHQAARPMRS